MPARTPPAKTALPRPSSANPSFELVDLLGYRLVRLSATIGQLADKEAAEVADLTLPEYRVLVVLLSDGPLGVAGLQQAMLIDKAWISRTLGKLAGKGLAVSKPDESDGRRSAFSLTAKGRRAATQLAERAKLRQAKILRGMGKSAVTDLLTLLDQVQKNVDEMA